MVIKISSLLFILSIIFTGYLFDPGKTSGNNPFIIKEKCASHEFNELMMQRYPQFRKNHAELEEFTKNFKQPDHSIVVSIPVVIHVVYNTAEQNISESQILSQIEILNKDYRKRNGDTNMTPGAFKLLAADVQFQFCLAIQDPGGISTSGITRTHTNITSFDYEDTRIQSTSLGGEDIWDRNKYLNLYVCNLNGYLGYAQYPGGPSSTDAVVIYYKAFGNTGTVLPPYHKGRTATHEIGHWFNLNHTWADDPGCNPDDGVADTPLQGNYDSGCPVFPKTDACSPVSPGLMFMNYMDYTDDSCMNIFTQGQSVRMLAALNGFRHNILNSNGCSPIGIQPISNEIPKQFSLSQNYPNPFNPTTKIKFEIAKASDVKIEIYDVNGKVVNVLINEHLNPGIYESGFDGSKIASGIYFYKILTENFRDTKRMVLIK